MPSGISNCQSDPLSSLYEVNNVGDDGRIRGSNDPQAIPERKKPYNVNIRPLNYGFVVSIGCQEFAVEDSKKMLETIGKYLENPDEMQKKWMEKREF